jgi:1,4-alpha-glucan branching enzyme
VSVGAPAWSRLSDDDLHWLGEGTHQQLYRHLGAHLVDDGPGGCVFAVWAPSAAAVAVIGDWNGWSGEIDRLARRGASGVWEGLVPAAREGARYKFRITTATGATLDKADPLARRAEVSPATASVITRTRHAWTDQAWMAGRAARQGRGAPISIYEVHLGGWRRRAGEVLGYRELGELLADHVTALGFTHVELMPVLEHPFYGSWGYQVTGYFAPTSRYGTPDDLRAMIDTLHRRGLGVILDWVPAHFPTDAHGLAHFDGTALYEHADPRRGFHPDWTSHIFNYGRHEVRSFLVSSARFWLDEFHADGLRVDGVASMLYRDYSRKPGEWIPDVDGSNHDREAIAVLRAVNQACTAAHPGVAMIAEESTAWVGVTAPIERGGLGFTFKWDLGWMNDTLRYLAHDPIHRSYHHDLLTFRSVYAGAEHFVLPLSHDEVVHGKRSLLGKLPGDPWQQLATLRLLLGYQWTTPGKKLLFAGSELAPEHEWRHDEELPWHLQAEPTRAGLARWIGDLNRAYRATAALHVGDGEPDRFRWLVAEDRAHGVYVYARLGERGAPPVVVVLSATPVVRERYPVPVPIDGGWRELLNSDAAIYGGSDVGNPGRLVSVRDRGGVATLGLTLPPLACVILIADP